VYIYIYINLHKPTQAVWRLNYLLYERAISDFLQSYNIFSFLKGLTCSMTHLTCLFNEHSGKIPGDEVHQSLVSIADVKNTCYSNSTSPRRLIAGTMNVLFLCRRWFGCVICCVVLIPFLWKLVFFIYKHRWNLYLRKFVIWKIHERNNRLEEKDEWRK
jgi:hypothetical protein